MRRTEIIDRLQHAVALAQAGQHAEARRLLQEVVAADPRQALAWVWLAAVAPDRDERVRCLENALALEPDNVPAQEAYQQLTGQAYAPPRKPRLAGGWRRALFGGPRLGLDSYLIILVAGLAVIVAFVLIARALGEAAQSPTPLPTLPMALPATPAPRVSPTPSNTPWPTPTPGPSPTSIWETPPPTWTAAPMATAVPSQTPSPAEPIAPTATQT